MTRTEAIVARTPMIHHQQTAHKLATAAGAAYWTETGTTIGDDHCLAHITRDGTDTIIAFQGTDDGLDWLSNADCRYATFPQGRVHNGFASSMAAWLDPLITEAQRVGALEQLWITGHSRGGAQALLFAAICAARGIAIAGVYTFGSPRVGDRRFAKWCDANIPGHHRYVNESDIVTRVPHFGYEHCGKLHWFDGVDWRTQMPMITRIGVWLFGRRWPFIGDTANDHGIGRYIEALSA